MPSALGRGLDAVFGDVDIPEEPEWLPLLSQVYDIEYKNPDLKSCPTGDYEAFLKLQMQLHIKAVKDCMKQEIPLLREQGRDSIAEELEQLVQSDTSDYDYWTYERAGKFNWNMSRPDITLIESRLTAEVSE